ncbi:Hemocyte protein-glutamine gamma-glutamyltransferase [Armadillidium nasatum]|uniref:Hemocyte protein-glutamine gamma-glutamyltransferase n=1 Tax=Armadillidium nasatum TaxID=96803 RepID=A0A5N5TJM0_9CRUS|nr:Hemocyte protein-glutamine gamma-glutamyltransferase [Armadillidium nasatum]
MSRNRLGLGHGNFVNNLRSNAVRELDRRNVEEEKTVDVEGATVNKVEKIHWYIKDNAKLHHTAKFDQIHDPTNPKPVLRRGQTFYVAIRLKDRDFDLEVDLYIPACAPVGVWRLSIRSGLQDRSQGRIMDVYNDDTDLYILFNPWCKDDLVYMEGEADREEYVMNDKGKVYVGAYRTPRGRPWAFGQFDDVVLPVACYILELSRHPHSERGNPVQVVRAVSAGVNNIDEEGILVGRWDGEYSDGTAPFKWTGSVRILEEYVKNGFTPVRYGQCWVFSALATTICRALGIPCRSVTNFVSAHDTNSSLTIDKFFDKDGNEIEGGPDGDNWDSVWNFHVWNDVWMARPDLPPGYGGWQAIDSTPQEESDHKMQCGPASLEAIRRGDISLGFDCPFVFAEVNADVMHWVEDENSDWGYSRMKIKKYQIGRLVLTRAPGEEDDYGESDQLSLLESYKNPEGSAAERLAIHNAIRGSRRAQQYYEYNKDVTEDVTFDLTEIDKTFSDEPRTISAALTARSVFYTGVHHSIIKKAEGKLTLDPQTEQDVALTIDYDEYWKHLQEHCMIKIYAICRVQETGQTWTDEDDFQVEKPKLNITAPESIERGEECSLDFSFENPLDETLTECQLSIDGSGLLRPKEINIGESVGPKAEFSYSFVFRPRIHGKRKVIVNFNSKQLFEISGSKSIEVLKPSV